MNGSGEEARALLAARLAAARASHAQRELAWEVLAFARETHNAKVRPSRATLARRTGRSPGDVFADLQALVAAGVLVARARRGAATTYDIAAFPTAGGCGDNGAGSGRWSRSGSGT